MCVCASLLQLETVLQLLIYHCPLYLIVVVNGVLPGTRGGGGRLQSVPAAHRTATAWRVYDSFYYRTTHMLRRLSTAETADVTQSASP